MKTLVLKSRDLNGRLCQLPALKLGTIGVSQAVQMLDALLIALARLASIIALDAEIAIMATPKKGTMLSGFVLLWEATMSDIVERLREEASALGENDEDTKIFVHQCGIMREAANEITALRSRLEQAEKERDRIMDLFRRQRERVHAAGDLWRAAHPGNDDTQPDLLELVEWLLSRAEAAEKALADARNAAFKEAARIADQYKQREPGNDSLDILSAISSYLGCGLGDENTTDEAFYKRIIWGIDNHANCGIDFGRRQAFKEAAQIVENAPLAQNNTEIAAAIRAKVTP